MAKWWRLIIKAALRFRPYKTAPRAEANGRLFIMHSICSAWRAKIGRAKHCTCEKKNCGRCLRNLKSVTTQSFPADRRRSLKLSNRLDWKALWQSKETPAIAQERGLLRG